MYTLHMLLRAIKATHTFVLRHPELLLTAILISLFALLPPNHEENDDVFMSLMISGLYGPEPTALVIHIHVFLSTIIKYLYQSHIAVNWYSITLYICGFASVIHLGWSMDKYREKDNVRYWLAYLIMSVYSLKFLSQLQFTTISALAGISGSIGILVALSSKKIDYKRLIIATLFLYLGYLVRSTVFYALIFAAAPAMVYVAKQHNRLILLCKIVLLVVSIVGMSIFTQMRAFEKEPGWEQFHKEQLVRGSIHGHTLFDPKIHKDTYERVGWSEVDTNMFFSWFYLDKQVFTPERTKDVLKIVTQLPNTNYLTVLVMNVLLVLLSVGSYIMLLVSIILLLRAGQTTFFLAFGGSGLVLAYLLYVGRFPTRSTLPLIFLSSLLYIIFSKRNNSKTIVAMLSQHYKTSLVLIAITVALAGSVLFRLSHSKQQQDTIKSIINSVPSGDTITFIWDSVIPYEWYQVTDPMHEFKGKQTLIGSWIQGSPLDQAKMRKFNMTNITTALYEKDNVYVVANKRLLDLLQKFIKQHYDVNVSYAVIKQLPSYERSHGEVYLVRLIKK